MEFSKQHASSSTTTTAAIVTNSAPMVSSSAECSSSSNYPDLRIVFDFFVGNPQVATYFAPEEGPGPSAVCKENPFYDRYWESIRSMQESPLFTEGILLRSLDCKPYYPYLHYIVYKNHTNGNGRGGSRMDTRNYAKISSGGNDTSSTSNDKVTPSSEVDRKVTDTLRCQGEYNEVHTFVARHTPLLPKRPSNPNAAYIVTAFKTAGNLDNLDKTWTYWSGADYIVENIPKNLKLERVTFHKLRCIEGGGGGGKGKDNFSYVLLCEIGEALGDLNRAREFIDTLKYRQCGVTSLYVIDHFF